MFIRLSAAALLVLGVSAMPASAGSVTTVEASAKTPSILFVGFDGTDAAGHPVCKACEAEKAAKKAELAKQFSARRRELLGTEPATETAESDVPPPSMEKTSAIGEPAVHEKPADRAEAAPPPPAPVFDAPLRGAIE